MKVITCTILDLDQNGQITTNKPTHKQTIKSRAPCVLRKVLVRSTSKEILRRFGTWDAKLLQEPGRPVEKVRWRRVGQWVLQFRWSAQLESYILLKSLQIKAVHVGLKSSKVFVRLLCK